MKVIKISLVGLLLISLVFFTLRTLGATFLNTQIQAQLDQAGLTSFVRYNEVSINPFTLSPSLHQVSFGDPQRPWLVFDSITLNKGVFDNRELDVAFQLGNTPVNNLSRDTRHLMKLVGLTELSAKGRFTSSQQGSQLTSNIVLDIAELGRLSLVNQMQTQLNAATIQEVRTDMLASMAFGQPEAIFLIYGEDITFYNIMLSFQDAGLTQYLRTNDSNSKALFAKLKNDIHAWGLAEKTSTQNEAIAQTLMKYRASSEQRLEISARPSSPMSLGELYLLSKDKQLANKANIAFSINN